MTVLRKNFPLKRDKANRHAGAYPLEIMYDALQFTFLRLTITFI